MLFLQFLCYCSCSSCVPVPGSPILGTESGRRHGQFAMPTGHLGDLTTAALHYLHLSLAPSSLATYRSGWSSYSNFCSSHRFPTLPLSEATLLLFCTSLLATTSLMAPLRFISTRSPISLVYPAMLSQSISFLVSNFFSVACAAPRATLLPCPYDPLSL